MHFDEVSSILIQAFQNSKIGFVIFSTNKSIVFSNIQAKNHFDKLALHYKDLINNIPELQSGFELVTKNNESFFFAENNFLFYLDPILIDNDCQGVTLKFQKLHLINLK